jgi:hypothetical protein
LTQCFLYRVLCLRRCLASARQHGQVTMRLLYLCKRFLFGVLWSSRALGKYLSARASPPHAWYTRRATPAACPDVRCSDPASCCVALPGCRATGHFARQSRLVLSGLVSYRVRSLWRELTQVRLDPSPAQSCHEQGSLSPAFARQSNPSSLLRYQPVSYRVRYLLHRVRYPWRRKSNLSSTGFHLSCVCFQPVYWVHYLCL